MPTITPPAHRLAALIAVEREAADRYRNASQSIYRVLSTSGTECPEYGAASAEEDASMRAMIHAQMDVDEALSTVINSATVAAASA